MLSDERAAFEEWCFANDLMAESHGVRSESRACDVAWLAWQARAEAAVKDAVGGDEPVAYLWHENGRPVAASLVPTTRPDRMCLPLYTRPKASASVPDDAWKPLLEAVMREIPSREYRGNAPGHAHSIPGIWDGDNRPELAGKPCAWCVAYSTARQMLAASQPEVKNAER